MLRTSISFVFVQVASACWGGGLTEEICCDLGHGPEGNAQCWDGQYTYSSCCPFTGTPAASDGVGTTMKVDPASVHTLALLGGGSMPMSGVGLCCRPSAQGNAVRQGVLDYLLLGGRHLDTAMLYDNHREVGHGVRQAIELGVPRDQIFLTSKIWADDYGFEATTKWMERTLEELGLEYVDLVLLHKPGVPDDLPCGSGIHCRQETWLALQRAVAQGKVRHLGVSNFGSRQMKELQDLQGAPVTTNQLEYHPWVPAKHKETVEWCKEQGIAVTAYGSMGSNGMAGQMLGQGALVDMGNQYGKTAAQVLLRWAVQNGVSVIPGTSNPKHQLENLNIFDFELKPHEMDMLNGIPEDQQMLHFGHTPDVIGV